MKKTVYLITAFLVAPCTLAQTIATPIDLRGGLAFSVVDTNKVEKEGLGYSIGAGYHVNKNVRFQLSYADYGSLGGENLGVKFTHLDINGVLPLSDYASIYIGGGGSYSANDTDLTANIGLDYTIDKNWSVDVSYRGIFDAGVSQQDLYAFNTMIVYRFTEEVADTEPRVELRPIEQKSPVVTPPIVEKSSLEKVVEPNRPLVSHETQCESGITQYRLKDGEYLNLIARRHDISLNELININVCPAGILTSCIQEKKFSFH
ncbi:porin family protein [Vibrio sp. RE86]|uniref:porin family protein n=1 Tax=Vibrio sp. RE86 TaxID=2607605 RepID=UPI00149384A5|nr:porin family protein [Vibrio sp. RE86]NOH79978.1 porin family protein [Vibrio sp. RE86]